MAEQDPSVEAGSLFSNEFPLILDGHEDFLTQVSGYQSLPSGGGLPSPSHPQPCWSCSSCLLLLPPASSAGRGCLLALPEPMHCLSVLLVSPHGSVSCDFCCLPRES